MAGGKFFTDQVVKNRESKLDEYQCQQKRKETQEDGFGKELPVELPPARSYDLANTHLICPLGGPGCRQVDEIDTGNDQDEQSNGRENNNGIKTPLRLQFIPPFRAEMDVAEGLCHESDEIP